MSTSVLPAINQSRPAKKTTFDQNVPSHNGQRRVVAHAQKQTKMEQEMYEKKVALRNNVPELNEWQTAQFRNNYKHNLCIQMLQQGYHRSFAELFGLIKYQAEERIRSGPDSVLWLQKPLTEEHEKLDLLMKYLVEGEKALLKNNYVKVYECHQKLAQHFQATGDKWLADHFFFNCLQWSASVVDDEGKVAADGYCNVGLSLEESGSFEDAAKNFEMFYSLAKEKPDWTTPEGANMYSQSCNHLTRIYTVLSDQYLAKNDNETCLSYLTQAYRMAQDGGDGKLFGEASYRLGKAYERNGDPATALMYLESYLDSCTALKDEQGIGKACEAIAKSYNSQGRIDESIRYLQRFIEVSEDSKDEQALSQACNSLGTRYNSQGLYDPAVEYFSKSYNLSRSLNDTKTISISRVLSGIAQGHKMLSKYNAYLEYPIWPCVSRLIEWKDNRTEENFKLPPPKPAIEEQMPNVEENSKAEEVENQTELENQTEGENQTEEEDNDRSGQTKPEDNEAADVNVESIEKNEVVSDAKDEVVPDTKDD